MRARKHWIVLSRNIKIYDACAESQIKINKDKEGKAFVGSAILIPLNFAGNEKIEEFVEGVLKHISPQYSPYFIELVKTMEAKDFDRSLSVTDTINFEIYGNDTSRYAQLSKISLLDHTIRVVKNTIEVTVEERIPQYLKDLCILAGLLHDFGKNHNIRDQYQRDKSDRHDQISANFAERTIKDFYKRSEHLSFELNKKLIDSLVLTLYEHHSKAPSVPKGVLRETLIKADFMAREQEIVMLGA